jgi:hypothetical protein
MSENATTNVEDLSVSSERTMSGNLAALKEELKTSETTVSQVPKKTAIQKREKKEKSAAKTQQKTSEDKRHTYKFCLKNYFSEVKKEHAGYFDSIDAMYKIYQRDFDKVKRHEMYERDTTTQKFTIRLRVNDVKKRIKELEKLN